MPRWLPYGFVLCWLLLVAGITAQSILPPTKPGSPPSKATHAEAMEAAAELDAQTAERVTHAKTVEVNTRWAEAQQRAKTAGAANIVWTAHLDEHFTVLLVQAGKTCYHVFLYDQPGGTTPVPMGVACP
jgi:hypothetical protein